MGGEGRSGRGGRGRSRMLQIPRPVDSPGAGGRVRMAWGLSIWSGVRLAVQISQPTVLLISSSAAPPCSGGRAGS